MTVENDIEGSETNELEVACAGVNNELEERHADVLHLLQEVTLPPVEIIHPQNSRK